MKLSFILTFMDTNSPERKNLLDATLNQFKKNKDIEICLHEIGPKQTINPENLDYKNEVKYCFSEWNEIFHRAWALNKCVRELASGDIIVLLDGDVLLPKDWIKKIQEKKNIDFCMGWSELFYISKKYTQYYLETGKIVEDPDLEVTRYYKVPKPTGAAGGITLVNRELFLNIKGIPEIFRGTWGREDNGFALKCINLGYNFENRIDAKIYHLHHDHMTPRVREIQNQIEIIRKWNKEDWLKHIKKVGDNWGK